MEERHRASAAARTGPPSVNSTLSLLRRLQSENEGLRSELLQSRQKNTSLQHQLDSVRASTDQIVKDAVAMNGEQMRALEERCRLLADRLLASKRDEQVSESARVGFLLRSQLEERRFLKRALVAMLETLADTDAAAAVAAVTPQAAEVVSCEKQTEEGDEVHTGTLYRLVMAASNALLAYAASVKLEKARTRLNLEHAVSVLSELHSALRDATRAAFEAVAHAGALEESLVSGSGTNGGAGGAPALTMLSRGSAFSNLRSGFTTPSPHRYRIATDSSANAGGGEEVSHAGSSTGGVLAPPSLPLSEELEWVCDVLKACALGLREVDSDIAAAKKGLTAPPTAAVTVTACRSAENTELHPFNLSPLAEAASPEMNELLRGFLTDLTAVKRQAAQQQEEMARQLTHEVERHYHSTQQYEERIKLLETECAKLLRYAERVAEERARGVSVSSSTTAATSQPQPTTQQTPLPQNQRQRQQQRERERASAASASDAKKPSINSPIGVKKVAGEAKQAEDEEEDANRVTPERYVVKRPDLKPAISRATREHFSSSLQPSATTSLLLDNSDRERSVRGRRQASHPISRADRIDADGPRENALNESTSAAERARQSARSLFTEISPNSGPTGQAAAKKALLSPRRGPPSEAAPTAPSAAAAALWSHYRTRNASDHGDAASFLTDRLSPRRYQRLMSPAPSPSPLSPARASTSPWRRSVTASVPSGWSGVAAEAHKPVATPLSSVSSTSEHLSTPSPAAMPTEGLVASQVRSRGPALVTSPDPREAALRAAGRPRLPPVVVPSAFPLAPPREAAVLLSSSPSPSLSPSPSAHSTSHTRLSQRVYDEAAADVFSSNSTTSFVNDVSMLTDGPQRQQQHHPSSHPLRGGDESPEVRQPSPRRPNHLGFYTPHTDARRALQEQLGFTPPPSPSQSDHIFRSTKATTTRRKSEVTEAITPPIWRRIKEEASFRQQQPQHPMPSPIAGASELFSTPPEVSWVDA